MRRARVWAFVGTGMLAATVANAAEPPVYQPPVYQQPVYQQPAYQPPPPPVLQPICVPRTQAYLWPGVPFCAEDEFAGGWYLRGDIGFTNQKVSKIENRLLNTADRVEHINSDFDSAGLFGLGVGVAFNNFLRFDVTGEYRMNSSYNGLDIVHVGGSTFTDEYRAKKSEWLFLANAYLDLGTWWCVTPFVGAGIGFSRVSISGFTDINTPNAGVAYGGTQSQWNFAWALHAGLAYQVTNNMAVEFAYRYTNLGDGIAGDAIDFNGNNNFNNPTTFKDLTSHDFKLGLRWTCCDDVMPAPPPPPVSYQPPPPPPPLYAPPVMRKG